MNHFNHEYDGGSPNIPVSVGDRYYGQDRARNFWYLVNESNISLIDLFDAFPVLLKNPAVIQGSSLHEIDIPIVSGIVKKDVSVPNDFSSIPPSVQTEPILIYILTTAQTDFDIQGSATLDGVTVNYLKVTYTETDQKSRSRAKKAGTYFYEVARSFTITCNSTAPTDYDLVLAEIVGDDSTFLTITNRFRTPITNLNYIDLSYEETTDNYTPEGKNRIIALTNNQEITLPDITEQGKTLEVFSKGFSQILQGDAENVISWKNKFYTTKGTSGYLQLRNKERVKLVYRGIDNRRIEPGVKLTNPAILPTGETNTIAFSYDGIYLAVPHISSPFITIYKRSGDTFTKLTDPAIMPTGDGLSASFSYDGIYLAVGHDVSPFITIYKRSGDTFTKLANPGTLPASAGRTVSFTYDGMYLAVGHLTTPFITIYKRSGDTFTKLTDPTSLPPGYCTGVAFSYDGNYLACSSTVSPYIAIYARSGDTFTRLTNPSTLPSGFALGVAFSYDGMYLAISHDASPYMTVYKRSGHTFERLANPVPVPAGTGRSCGFSYDGMYLAVGHANSPYVTIYKRSGDTFTKLTDPASLIPQPGNGCSFSYDGIYLAVGHANSPYVTIYKNTESANKVWEAIEIDTLYEDNKRYMLF